MYFESDMNDVQETFAPLNFDKKKYIIAPINDKEDKRQAVGGSHWSLLLYVVQEDYFVYFDSTSGIIPSTYEVAMKIYAVTHKTLDHIEPEQLRIGIYKNSPQQKNSYDCGMYVLTVTEKLANVLMKEQRVPEDKSEEFSDISPNYVTEQRKRIYELISKLSGEKKE